MKEAIVSVFLLLAGTMAKYERKSITYFKMVSLVPLEKGVYKSLEKMIRERIEMPRFDYNEVEISGDVSLEDLAKIIRNYVDAIKMERAKAEAQMDWRYKDLVITAEDLRRIAESAYIYWPAVEKYKVRAYWGKCIIELPIIGGLLCRPTSPREKGAEFMVETNLKLRVKYYRVRFEDAKLEYVADIIQSHRFVAVKRKFEGPQDTKERSIEGAIDFVTRKINKETRKIKDFMLVTPVQSASLASAWLELGEKEGLKKDALFEIVEFLEGGGEKRVGWIKATKIASGIEKQSKFQVIAPWKLEGGELAREYPQIGLSAFFDCGIRKIEFNGEKVWATSLGGGAKFSFAQFFNIPISEMYLVPRLAIPLPKQFEEFSGELGFEKRFGIKRLFIGLGAYLGYIKVSDLDWTLGMRFPLALDIFITSWLSIHAHTSYRAAGELISYSPSGVDFVGGLVITF